MTGDGPWSTARHGHAHSGSSRWGTEHQMGRNVGRHAWVHTGSRWHSRRGVDSPGRTHHWHAIPRHHCMLLLKGLLLGSKFGIIFLIIVPKIFAMFPTCKAKNQTPTRVESVYWHTSAMLLTTRSGVVRQILQTYEQGRLTDGEHPTVREATRYYRVAVITKKTRHLADCSQSV